MLRLGRRISGVRLSSLWNAWLLRRLSSSKVLAAHRDEDPRSAEAENGLALLETETEAGDVPSLLQRAASYSSVEYSFKAFDILAKWNATKKVDFEEQVAKDPSFPKIQSVVEKKGNHQNVNEILRALGNLLSLGVGSDSFIIQSLENDLLWNVRKVTVRSLLTILSFQFPVQETPRQKKVVEQTIAAIERRWVEFQNAHDISMAYSHYKVLHPNFIGHLDERVMELAESMSPQDLSKIVCALAVSRRRCTPILRSAAFHIAKKSEMLTPKQIANLLFALKSLSFSDAMLLERLSGDLILQINDFNQPAVIETILTCMGQMRWRPTQLIDALAIWLEKNIHQVQATECASFILTLGTVSYVPDNGDDLTEHLLSKLNRQEMDKNVWLDIVWSLVLMRKASEYNIASVLSPDFVRDLPTSDISNLGIKLKLMNVNAAVQMLYPDYSGPFLENVDAKSLLITKSRRNLSLSKHILKTLHNFLPPNKYLREEVHTDMGFTIDAEIVVDKNGKPVPVVNYQTPFNSGAKLEPLPQDAHCIALMIFHFKDYTLETRELTGINRLAVDLLWKKGYKVVQIPYYEYNMKEKTLKNVQYFESKIKNCISHS